MGRDCRRIPGTGHLSLISEFNLSSRAILVTSRYEEPQVTQACQRLGVRLIPKGMAGYVPIGYTQPKQTYDAILIDDDLLTQSTWSAAARKAKKNFLSFESPELFFERVDEFDRASPVFVDSNLGDGIKGEVVAQEIFELGFTSVYLATGYEASVFAHLRFLKGVVGKDPVF